MRYPDDPLIALNHAWVAHYMQNWPEAAKRWERVRALMPDVIEAYVKAAHALRMAGEVEAAEAVILNGTARFPENTELLLSFAWLATYQQQWQKAAERWRIVRLKLPQEHVAYLCEGKALMRLRKREEAERIFLEGSEKFPLDADLMAEAARTAMALHRKDMALVRWAKAFELAPQLHYVQLGYGEALGAATRYAEAEEILSALLVASPHDLATWMANARLSGERGDWQEALLRWQAIREKFADNQAVFGALNSAAMNALLSDRADIASALEALAGGSFKHRAPADAVIGDADMEAARQLPKRDLLMLFESLGDNCEFGIVQRNFGAEPLSLLRWTSTLPDILATALRNNLDGVGLPENTRIFEDHDYRTKDTRYGMIMHTFITPDQATPEQLFPKFCKRLQYLKGKLLDDLRTAEKIFVYKAVRAVSDADVTSLWQAIRSFGDNTLLVARIADAEHPPGSVRVVDEGFLMGYFDRTSTTDPSFDVWLEICHRAYAIWQNGKAKPGNGQVLRSAAE
jgi:tetratricopeptide (TPR) repeat protein